MRSELVVLIAIGLGIAMIPVAFGLLPLWIFPGRKFVTRTVAAVPLLLLAASSWREGYLVVAILGLPSLVYGITLLSPLGRRWHMGALFVGTYGAACGLAALAVLLGGAWERHRITQAIESHPVKDIGERLPSIPPKIGTSVDKKRLENIETAIARSRIIDGKHMWDRTEALELLHRGKVSVFSAALGFGDGRMPEINRPHDYINLPPPEPRQQASSLPISESSTPDIPQPMAKVEPPKLPDWETVNTRNVASFVNQPGWGYVPEKGKAAGFQAHAFRTPAFDDEKWKVDRIELVSLLKHETPGVYISDRLPAMEELKDAKTRPLDDFEKTALAKLIAGAEVEFDPRPNHVRMLGAVRAIKECAKCHDCQPGDLLGAFSYRLVMGK